MRLPCNGAPYWAYVSRFGDLFWTTGNPHDDGSGGTWNAPTILNSGQFYSECPSEGYVSPYRAGEGLTGGDAYYPNGYLSMGTDTSGTWADCPHP
mgnify:CR=1 FL=1